MPIYEMVMICKISETQALVNLMRQLTLAVFQEGGVIRRFLNLGDRIGAKTYRSKDGKQQVALRYMSVEFDANPDTMKVAEKVARLHGETMQVFVHKMKDRQYYKQMFNYEAWKQYEIEPNYEEYEKEMITLDAKNKLDLSVEGGNVRKEIEKELNKRI